MQKKLTDTRYMVMLAMFCALMLVLQATGIGLIPLPFIKLTVMHVPVILGAIVLGTKAGGILGGVFGLCSIWANIKAPAALSFAFNPILAGELCGFWGALAAVWTALICRILLGIAAGLIWELLKKWKINDFLALPITAGIATVFHSLIVMGSIGLMFAPQFAEAKGIALDAVFGIAMGIVGTSGIPEAIAAIILVTALGKVLLALTARMKPRRK